MGKARGLGLAALVIAILAGVAVAAWTSQDHGSAAGPVRRVIIPEVASDSVPTSDPATRVVVIAIELAINEPAITGSGTTLVNISATAHGPLPGQLDPPVTRSGSVSITTHPGDVCAWNPVIVTSNFTMTYSQPQGSNLSLHMNFSGLEWYYQVVCPGETIRFPAGSVNESLTGWLFLIGLGGPAGATIDTPVVSEDPISCVKRKGIVSNTNSFGTGTVTVWVTQPPCLIPVE